MVVPALCAFHPKVIIKSLANGCEVTAKPDDTGCEHKRKIVHLAAPDLEGVYVPFVHHDCTHNQMMAIHNRVCGVVPEPTELGLKALHQGMNIIIHHLPTTIQEPLGHFAEKYSGRKRSRYMDAVQHILENGLSKRDSGVTMFIKAEKMNPLKPNPDPRAIQFRDPKYCVVLASYLKPIEEHLYALKIRHPLMSGTRLVGKGLNQVERACLLRKKMSLFRRPVVVSIDASRFDQHVDVEQLKEEHRVYTSCNNDPYFKKILSWQLKNQCRTRLGVRYTTLGKRMSGDMNTALGNCIIMIGMVLGFMIPRGKKFDMFDDGDDCLIIVEEEELSSLLSDLPPAFLEYGHEMKIENIARTIEEVVWCQSSPVETKHGLKFVRNPFKVISTALVGTRWLNVPGKVRLSYLAGLAECELVLNSGVPVLQEYALALARNSHGAVVRHDDSSGEWFRYLRESRLYRRAESGKIDSEISDTARLSFAQAFGISTDQQHDMERKLRHWNFDVASTFTSALSWDPIHWVNERELVEFQ